ncbi:MAG TPA: hypothetical protein VJS64_14685 [Pyrinomonadaceae bacterium]|nr:hypothetical protein [Pyrinomonadaceae bacterium]
MFSIRNRKEIKIALTLFFLAATVYLSFPTKNYYWDGIFFARSIEDAPRLNASLLHPNHLTYNLLGYVFYRALRALGFDLRAITALQILNGILAAVCAFIFYWILKQTLRSIYWATTLTVLFAFSATWWKFATDADSYIVSILFLLISFYLILPGKRTRPLLVAFTFTAAMLFHQLAVLFYPVVVAGLFFQARSQGTSNFVGPLSFSIVAFAVTGAAYCVAYYLITGTFHFQRFVQWTTSYSPDVNFSFNLWNNFFYSARGHGRLFLGGRFNAIEGLINPFILFLMLVLAIAIMLFLYKVISRLLRRSAKSDLNWLASLKSDRQRWETLILATIWTIAYLVFLFVWLPHNTFYRLFYLPALIMIVGIVLSAHDQAPEQQRHYRLALLTLIVALLNFLFLIFPYSHARNNPPLAFALEMKHALPRNTIIYYGSANSDNSLVRYFNQGTNWKQLNLEQANQVEQELREAKAQGVSTWLETSALDQLSTTPNGTAWLQKHVKAGRQNSLLTKTHNIRFVQVEPAD